MPGDSMLALARAGNLLHIRVDAFKVEPSNQNGALGCRLLWSICGRVYFCAGFWVALKHLPLG